MVCYSGLSTKKYNLEATKPCANQLQTLDAGWPESEEGQVGNVKLEEEVKRRSNEDNLVK